MNIKIKALWFLLTVGLFFVGIYQGLHPDLDYKAPLVSSGEIKILTKDRSLLPVEFIENISSELGLKINIIETNLIEQFDIQVNLADGADIIWTHKNEATRLVQQSSLTYTEELNPIYDSIHPDFLIKSLEGYFVPLLWDKTELPAQLYGFCFGKNKNNLHDSLRFLKLVYNPDWAFTLAKITVKGTPLKASDQSELDYHLRASRIRDR